MKHTTKLKTSKFLLKIIKPSTIQILFIILILLYPLYSKSCRSEDFEIISIFDIPTFTSIFLAYTAAGIATTISEIISRKLEDHLKLNSDYNLLIKKYPNCDKFITYTNSLHSNYKKGRKLTSVNRINKQTDDNKDKYKFPVTLEKLCYNNKFEIIDSTNQYELPSRIMDHYDEIMIAHKHSNIYNQLNIRMDGYSVNNNVIQLRTSRTTYYNSLVTNRAMDFKWGSNMTVREIYGVGPFLKELEESELSNHLGFNGLVETSDNKIIFVKRYNNVSIGKGTLGNSIGASLKAKYAINADGKFTLDGLTKGIKSEINDELKINSDCYDFSLEKNIIAIYRDIVEGGKPQLLVYVKLNIDFNEVKSNFFRMLKEEKQSKDIVSRLNVDGKKIIGVDRSQLDKIYIAPDIIVIGNKAYKMMPSASASIVILLEYFKYIEK